MILTLFITFIITNGQSYYQIYNGFNDVAIANGFFPNTITSNSVYESDRLPLNVVLKKLGEISTFDERAIFLLKDIDSKLSKNQKAHILSIDMSKRQKRPNYCPIPDDTITSETCNSLAAQQLWQSKILIYKNFLNMDKQMLQKGNLEKHKFALPILQELKCNLYDLTIIRSIPCKCPFYTDNEVAIPNIGQCNNTCPLTILSKFEDDFENILAYSVENTYCKTQSRLCPCDVDTLLVTPHSIGEDFNIMCKEQLRAAPTIYNTENTQLPNITTINKVPTSNNNSPLSKTCSYKNGPYQIDGNDYCNGYIQFLPIMNCLQSHLLNPNSKNYCNSINGCKPCEGIFKPATGCFVAQNNVSYIGFQCFKT